MSLCFSGIRVGVAMGCRKEYIKADRIVIPADADRSKVRCKKRHLEDMAYVIPRTAEIDRILEDIARVARIYGDVDTWLFPSRTSESGHMEEERAAATRLRQHALIRFTVHQLRHNVATAGEEVGFRKSEIAELLGHTTSNVTDRYIDQRVNRHRELLVAINEYLSHAIFESPSDVGSAAPRKERRDPSARAIAGSAAEVERWPHTSAES
jgi:integrase